MLRRRTATADHVAPGVPSRRDRGVTFIEILVSVVLLGTVVVAVLAALATSIRGSVTHEEKVAALSTLTSGASALRDLEPTCDALGYQNIARAAVDDPLWAGRLDVADLDCSGDLHEVTLRVAVPDGLQQELEVVIGGPSVATGPGGGDFIEIPLSTVSCAVTSLTATPSTVLLADAATSPGRGVLSESVTIVGVTDVPCPGDLIAQFSPPPIDSLGDEIQPSFGPIEETAAENDYRVTISAGQLTWLAGEVGVTIVHDEVEGASSVVGVEPALLELTCTVTVTVSDDEPIRAPDERLLDDLVITATFGTACPEPGSPTYSVDTGVVVAMGSMTSVGSGVWQATIPGTAATGPLFASGARTIEILTDAGVVGDVVIVVDP